MSELTQDSPNTFLSWSMDRSKAVATALRAWLPLVVQSCEPWMSSEDIHAGKRWRREVAERLGVKIGILCLTRENVARPWINFEAGALSRSVSDDSRVIPYCFDLNPADYGDPLGDFNGVKADREGTLKLVRSINAVMDKHLKDYDLDRVFDRMWVDLHAQLVKISGPAIPASSATKPGSPIPSGSANVPMRSDRELLEELLARVRNVDLDSSFVGPGRSLEDVLGRFDASPMSEGLRQLATLGSPTGAQGGSRVVSTIDKMRLDEENAFADRIAERAIAKIRAAEPTRFKPVIPEIPKTSNE